MTATANVQSLHDTVTARIISELEAGRFPWVQPWASSKGTPLGLPQNASTGRTYSGVNILLLWSAAIEQGRPSQRWLTFKQALAMGGAVRKGEKGTMVVYADTFVPKAEQEKAAGSGEEARRVGFLKRFTVFHRDQCDGLPPDPDAKPLPGHSEVIPHVEDIIAATGADIRHGGSQAYYALQPDHVQMPPFECFEEPEGYYATLAHECTHWTRHPTRLDRDFGRSRWGDEGYAREELVAELGAAFLCADLGLELEPRPDHASYIASWMEVLKDDRRFIFTAAAYAQRAADFLHQKAAPAAS